MSEPIKKCSEWPLLTQSEVNEFLRTLPQFTLLRDSSSTDGKIINKLRIKFLTINFVAALEFIQQAGLVAEAQGHHPDFHLTGWNNVEVIIFTHSLQGLTENDFILAKSISEIPVAYSKKFLTDNPTFASS